VKKPIYLLPFILVYKMVSFIGKMPYYFLRYFSIGFYLTINSIIKFIFRIFLLLSKGVYKVVKYVFRTIFFVFKYEFYGFIYLSIFVYKIVRLFKYDLYGFIYLSMLEYRTIKFIYQIIAKIVVKITSVITRFSHYVKTGFTVLSFFVYKFFKYEVSGFVYALIIPPVRFFVAMNKRFDAYQIKKKEDDERKFQARRDEAIRKTAERIRKEEEKKAKRDAKMAERKRLKARGNVTYQNENVKIEKKKFADYINDVLVQVIKIPNNIKQFFVNKYKNSAIVRNRRNKQDIEREALMISFEGDDAQRSESKILFEYVARNSEGKVVKGYFDAYSKVEVHSFLLSEGYEVYSIRTNQWIRLLRGSGRSGAKIKTKDLVFFLTQLSTYIKAGIPLVESLKILSRQFKNKAYQRVFRTIIYDLSMGDPFSEALAKQGDSFPRLLVNMVRASEMTGQLPEVLDDMSEYFTEMDKTRKQMITAMMYPIVILTIAVVVVVFILIFVIPQFVGIYESMDSAKIPAFTLVTIQVSNFLQKNIVTLIIGFIIAVLIFRYLFQNVKMFKTLIQWILMHIPPFDHVMIYNEVTMFTKTFSSLLAHNVFITDSMEILNKITNNEIYKMLILDTITNLAKGEKISESFKNHWAFPVPAYEMIVTGEKTGQLPEMMGKVANYYQELHANSVSRIKTFIEPVLIIFLTVVVGGIVMSIIIPMFNMYSSMQAG
jgi:type IV pilus assembly protein PilC